MPNSEILERGWYVTRTLIGGGPDINRRALNRGPIQVAVFNAAMEPWDPWQDELLQHACEALNKLEGL